MLDAQEGKITKVGTITIKPDGWIEIGDDWETEGCSCREHAVLASLHGLAVLQAEVAKTIQKPGGGKIAV